MKGWERSDYGFFGGRTPLMDKLRRQSERAKEWPLIEEPLSESQIAQLETATTTTLQNILRARFFTLNEMRALLRLHNAKKQKHEQLETYDFLEVIRDLYCIPAMYDFLTQKSITMRLAVLQRLEACGIHLAALTEPLKPLPTMKPEAVEVL
jgi:hypothetical protein